MKLFVLIDNTKYYLCLNKHGHLKLQDTCEDMDPELCEFSYNMESGATRICIKFQDISYYLRVKKQNKKFADNCLSLLAECEIHADPNETIEEWNGYPNFEYGTSYFDLTLKSKGGMYFTSVPEGFRVFVQTDERSIECHILLELFAEEMVLL